MNDVILDAVSKSGTALHDLYKSLAKAYINEHLDLTDLNEYLNKDYRLLSLFDISKFTLKQKKDMIDSNIETFYELYKDHNLEIFDYVIRLDTCYPNICNTILNSLQDYPDRVGAFNFVFKNIDIFANTWAFSNFLNSYKDTFTCYQLGLIIKHDGIKYAEFIDDYSDEILNYEGLKGLAKCIVDKINKDNDYFYEFIEKIAMSTHDGGEFLYVADQMNLNFEYGKIIESILKIQYFEGDFECIKTLVEICINNNWLSVFNDTGIDYISFSFSLYTAKHELDLSKITLFNGEYFTRHILNHISYAKWQDVKRFTTYTNYVKIKLEDYFK